MTKTLLLLRHGEADNAPRDIDRPLTPRGFAGVQWVQKQIVALNQIPQKILCSPAKRTRDTCGGIIAGLPAQPEIEFIPDFYGATPEQVMTFIQQQDAERVMVIGHNPWVHVLALTLCASGELNKQRDMKTMFPPASCAIIEFAERPKNGTGTLLHFFYPSGK